MFYGTAALLDRAVQRSLWDACVSINASDLSNTRTRDTLGRLAPNHRGPIRPSRIAGTSLKRGSSYEFLGGIPKSHDCAMAADRSAAIAFGLKQSLNERFI